MGNVATIQKQDFWGFSNADGPGAEDENFTGYQCCKFFRGKNYGLIFSNSCVITTKVCMETTSGTPIMI